ncbi:MAG TPA: gamma-glutamyltransferase [Kineosporiaceae bacterium]|nr:gamma-glutamyltransferase [Kineosporiaceae bacterium]
MRMRRNLAVTAAFAAGSLIATAAPAGAHAAAPAPTRLQGKQAVAVGYGGAVSTVDLDASKAAVEVLRKGGNAADAAIAAAATLGVTEPFSSGIGGGGYFVYYDARSHRVSTVDGRETGPAAFRPDIFVDPSTGTPYAFATAVTSGLSVGVPGTPATWQTVARRFGSKPVAQLLQPAIRVAERGFVVDQTFHDQVASNAARFGKFTTTSALYLRGGQPPAVGSTFRNPDLAATYRQLARKGLNWFYTGPLAREIARTAQHPPLVPGTAPVLSGVITAKDIRGYSVVQHAPTHVSYRGLDVYSIAPSSSGGTTVGEALNILENVNLKKVSEAQALHDYLEASRRAYADRNRYIGDPAYLRPSGRYAMRQLLTQGFADERFCTIDQSHASPGPVPPGTPDGSYDPACRTITNPDGRPATGDTEGLSTTHLVVTDKRGDVASYTLTIEQTGGNGMVVPGRGFLLNNEMTDFDFGPPTPGVPDPNLPAAGKRPRSSMSPTIVLRHGSPFLAVGSPGGATIITTVLQTLINRIDLGYSLEGAIAAPRASQRNQASGAGEAEPAFLASPVGKELQDTYGQKFTENAEIGAATGLEFLGHGLVLAAAEPVRRGGGSALVVRPKR